MPALFSRGEPHTPRLICSPSNSDSPRQTRRRWQGNPHTLNRGLRGSDFAAFVLQRQAPAPNPGPEPFPTTHSTCSVLRREETPAPRISERIQLRIQSVWRVLYSYRTHFAANDALQWWRAKRNRYATKVASRHPLQALCSAFLVPP